MALTIEAGWDFAHFGKSSMTITESGGGGAAAVEFTSGTYCHADLTGALGAGDYDDFAGAFEAALEAASPNTVNYTVTYSLAAKTYTIAPFLGTVTLTFAATDEGNRLRRLLGFSATQSAASSHVSDQDPWGIFTSAMGAKSSVSDDSEEGLIEEAMADDGTTYVVAQGTMAIRHDFTLPFEPMASIYSYPHGAASAEDFALQDLWTMLRPGQPFLLRDGSEDTVHQLTARGALFKPARVTADYDDLWNMAFPTYMRGRL